MARMNIIVIVLLFILLAFHGLNNYFVLTKSTYCLRPDNFAYLEKTMNIFYTLKEFRLNINYFRGAYLMIFHDAFKPPLFFITAAPFVLFGINKDIVAMSNLIYLGVLLFASYGIGKMVFNSRSVGLFSAFFISCFPAIFPFSRVLMVDFALVSMVTLSAYLFLLHKFDNLIFSVLAGFIIGLSFLSKQTYLIFFPGILIIFFLKKENWQNSKNIRNLFISLTLAFIVAANFYILNFSESIKYLSFNMVKLAYSRSPFYYLNVPLKNKLFLVFSLPFLLSLIYLVKEKKYGLVVLIFFPLLLCSILNNKLERFVLPVIPFIIISTTGFLWSFIKIRKPLFIILSVFIISLYFGVSYQGVLPIKHDFAKKFLLGSDYYNIE
ncbi:MAG: glycosyltransferase family 39 protein, partial [Candidatus Omnitrophica bacterium]|nr:glycosyltransferase family 39 protein [Candidatus Omnitrophota bacterium]